MDNYQRKLGRRFITEDRLLQFDAKTKLQEKTMALYKSLPEYRATQLDDMSFQVELFINDKLIADICDISKKKAETKLAQMALKNQLYLTEGEEKC